MLLLPLSTSCCLFPPPAVARFIFAAVAAVPHSAGPFFVSHAPAAAGASEVCSLPSVFWGGEHMSGQAMKQKLQPYLCLRTGGAKF